MTVSHPNDPFEREAEDVAARIVSGPAPRATPGVTVPRAVRRSGAVVAPEAPAPARQTARDASVPGGPSPPTASPDVIAAGGDVPVSAAVSSVVASPGAGESLDRGVQTRVESHLGVDLSGVRVHRGPDANEAATELQARAFTVGSDIFLRKDESPADLRLMAHEATHVVQQMGGVGGAATMRDFEFSDLVPDFDFVLDGVRSAAREIPGYALLSVIIGQDPITDEPVNIGFADFAEQILTFGPFADAVGPVLQAIDVLGDIVTLLKEALAAHDLTLARIGRDISAAWDEMSIDEGIDGNLAIIERYVLAIVADVRAFVDSIIDTVLAKVREFAVGIVQRLLLERPEIAPYWNLAVKVFHRNPLTGEDVNAPTVEILADFLTLIGHGDVVAQMTERDTLQKTADWLDLQWARFIGLLGQAGALFSDAWAAISPENLPSLVDNLTSLAQRAFDLISDVGAFAWDVIAEVLVLVKKSLLGWLSEHAHKVPGFHLLTVILEKNPFTDEAVPRTVENLIKGFITLLPGGEQMYAELAQTGVVGEAAGRIESEMTRLNISWELITGTFASVWDLVTLESLLTPLDTFERILDLFGEPLGRIIEFVSVVIREVITLILRMMNFPTELLGNIIDNAIAAIEDIKNDPIGFLRNVVAAMRAGFESFFGNIATHLLQGLGDWLFRGLRGLGIEPPTSLTVESVITTVIQVLGVTAETLWTKLGERIGPENVERIRGAIDTLTGAWTFIKDVQERGITAVWEFISGQLSNLWDTILNTAKNWIMSEIVDRVVARLLTMLDPTGVMAIVNGTIAFFSAVQSAIEYLREMLEIVDRYVSTISSIARGDVGPGAEMLEAGLATSIPVAIGFLANQVGLGDVPEKVKEIIEGLRQLVDEALDWLFDQAMALGQAALGALGVGAEPPPVEQRWANGMAVLGQLSGLAGDTPLDQATVEMATERIQGAFGFTSIEARPSGESWVLDARMNPSTTIDVARLTEGSAMTAEEQAQIGSELAEGGQTTYGAMSVGGELLGTRTVESVTGHGHSEQLLIREYGAQAITLANQATAQGPDRVRVVLAINRSPCFEYCAPALMQWILHAQARLTYPERVTFVLAPYRLYEPAGMRGRAGATTLRDLERLAAAGWELAQLLTAEEQVTAQDETETSDVYQRNQMGRTASDIQEAMTPERRAQLLAEVDRIIIERQDQMRVEGYAEGPGGAPNLAERRPTSPVLTRPR